MSLFAVELNAALQQKVPCRHCHSMTQCNTATLLNSGVEMTKGKMEAVDPRVRI
jgi:hypothetical protein